MTFNETNISRCQFTSCNKKLTIVNNYKCECGNFYCVKHRFSLDHECTFDYKNKQKELLQKNLVKISVDKVVKI